MYGFWNGSRFAAIGQTRYREQIGQGIRRYRASAPKGGGITAAGDAAAYPRPPEPPVSVIAGYYRALNLPENFSQRPNGNDDIDGLRRYTHYSGNLGTVTFHIQPEDGRAILAASGDGKDTFRLPKAFAFRFARGLLFDAAPGHGDRWTERDIHVLNLRAKMVADNARTRTFEFSGNFRLRRPQYRIGEFGFEGAISGRFEVNKESNQVSGFRANAEGTAWGDRGYHDNPNPPEPFTLGIAFVEPSDTITRSAPP